MRFRGLASIAAVALVTTDAPPADGSRDSAHDPRVVSSASLDRLLGIVIAAIALTGAASLHGGAPSDTWLFLTHDILAGVLAALVAVKLARSLPPALAHGRRRPLAIALVLAGLTMASLAAGYAWVAGGRLVWLDMGFASWTLLTLHAWIGLLLVPVVAVHLVPRRWRLLRPGRNTVPRAVGRVTSRRSFLVGAALLVAGTTLAAGTAALERLTGGTRRFTGSRWLPPGSSPVATTFLGEAVPEVDPAAWRIQVGGRVAHELDLSLAELQALPTHDLHAVLDCTSGWALDAAWTGVDVAALLDRAGADPAATAVTFRAVTGWSAWLPIADARRGLLAWAIDGRPLPIENGAPLRLVAPDHRGLEWVKWVESIQVT
jgi:DMSO/TMAO reductase YedYZ molybdopterin-dependent catalytic subunit